MTDSDAVRRVAAALPRAYEVEVRGRAKFRVKQIVFVAFSRDETEMGFGFPKAERDGLVASDPQTFYLPGTADLRYQWVCAHLGRLLGFGHLTFESAAQDQGLRDIRYVARADERDLKIQRVVQVVGLRGPRVNQR